MYVCVSMNNNTESNIDLPSPSSQSSFINTTNRCCFCIPYGWQKVRTSSSSSSSSSFSNSNHNSDKTLWSRGVINVFKKIREWSEIVAGPRWKTFIRSKFNRNRNSFGHKQSSAAGGGKFQYDPLDYALNFDDGPLENGDSEFENEYMVRNFSSRYVSPRAVGPIGAKTTSSMDHGKGVTGSNLV